MSKTSTALAAFLGMLASVIPATTALAVGEGLVINEIDYDQPGVDSAEFIEIYNPTADAITLSGVELRLVNGANGTIYNTIALGGELAAGDYLVICGNAGTTPNCDGDVSPDTDLVQNGAPDAVTLVDATGAVPVPIDTVSYEGNTLEFTEGTGATAADSNTVPFVSLSRSPNGNDTDDNDRDFILACTTPGEANAATSEDCDDPNPPPPPPPSEADLKVNEVDYDQDGTDTAEFVEIYNAGSEALDLAAFELRLINGSGGGASLYDTIALSETLAAGDFYVVCANSATTPNCDLDDGPDTNFIQNGSPDAVAIVQTSDGAIVDTLSYEGDSGAPYTEGTGAGEDDPNVAFAGLSRNPDGADSDNNSVDFTLACITPGGANTTVDSDCTDPNPPPPGDPYTELTIPEIQGPGHISPHDGAQVRTTGVVTATDTSGGRGFYLQDAAGDGNDATSDAIFVFTGAAPTVAKADQVTVEGTVSEFTPGGTATGNLSTTQITLDAVQINSSGNALPAAVVIGAGGRLPPTEVIEDDAFGSFDPTTDGLDFLEAVEAMLVTVKAPTMVGGTTFFGELFVIPDGVSPTQMSERGTMNISPDDFNPERIQIDPDTGVLDIDAPFIDTGAELSDVTGVVGYAFGNFEVIPTNPFEVTRESRLDEERTSLRPRGSRMTLATYNVLNLDPNDADGDTDIADGRFDAIAKDIVRNLRSPDIVALQEIQDNDGTVDSAVTAADQTLQLLVDRIAAMDGPRYRFIDNTFIGDDTSGGVPGGNIRVAYLYNPRRVSPVGAPDTVASPAFADARLPLVQTFEFRNREFTLVNNHFSSKSGSAPLYGTLQNSTERQEDPAVNASLDERRAQAQAVHDYLAPALANGENVVVLGDFNEFEFITPLDEILTQGLENLTLREGPDERYSFIFEGNSQSLDHILVSDGLSDATTFDAVHINAEFAATFSRASDHDPLLASINVSRIDDDDDEDDDDDDEDDDDDDDDDEDEDEDDDDDDYTLFVLHNNDGESDFLPDALGAGSISRFGGLVIDQKEILDRGRDQGAVTITAGDNFLASPEFQASLDKGVPFYDSIALDYLPYDAFTIGNHEFDFGPETLADFINGIDDCRRTPFLSANLVFDAEPTLDRLVDKGCIEPSTVIRRDGQRIGVIGLTTPDLREVSSPGNVEILSNLAEIANEEAARMTRRGVDIILIASHLQDLDNEVALAGELRNVDAIIGGGGGEELAEARTATTADGVIIPIVTVPGDYFDVGRLRLDFDDDGGLTGFEWALLDVTGDLPQDSFLLRDVEQPVADFVAALDETVVAVSDVGLNGVRAEVRTRETNVGNLLSDSFVTVAQDRAAAFGVSLGGPIVGLQNGGGIRNDSVIGPGNITLLHTFDIAPFANFVSVITDVSSADLVAAVEHGLSGLPGQAGSFAQWSGLVVHFDPTAPAGSRIVDLSVNGIPYVEGGALVDGLAPVDLATIDFLAAGNDGYDMFEADEFTRLGTSYQQSLREILEVADLSTDSVEYKPRVAVADRTRIIPTS